MLKQLFVRIILTAALLLSIAPWANRARAEGEAVNGTYVVDRSDDTIVTACTAAANDCTLRGAVQNANASAGGDTITFAAGVNVTLTSGWIDLTGGSITIQGNGRGATTINAPNTGDAAFRVASSNNVIRDLSIIGDGPGIGANQDGVWITSGTGNQVLYTAIYYMGGSGVRVAQTATNNTISNNYLGAPANANGTIGATCLYANERYGLDLNTNSNTANANTMVCNKLGGVHIANSAQSNSLRSNTIGVTTDGVRLSNQTAGVIVEGGAKSNAIGGGTSIERNTISGNTGYGVIVRGDGTDSNTIANSYIGLSPTGTLAISNTLGGVSIEQAAALNTVQYNIIGGNGGPGVQVLGTGVVSPDDTYYNKIYSNTIGLISTPMGLYAVPNTVGVYVFNVGLFTEIGGYSAGALIPNTGNLIGGNKFYGVHLYNAHSVTVAGNGIGSDFLDRGIANQSDGVRVEGNATANTLIVSNTLGYNGGSGLRLTLLSTAATVKGNTIRYNALDGVQIDNGSNNNLIGDAGLYNYIGSNKRYGVQISGSTATTNTLTGNTLTGNTLDGLSLLNGTRGNSVVVASVSNNGRHGVQIAGGAKNNRVLGALVQGNAGYGILITGTQTSANLIDDGTIRDNGLDGIGRSADATYNSWTKVGAVNNGGLNIDTALVNDTGNTLTPPYPIITSVVRNGDVVTLTGKTEPHVLGETVEVEIYSARISAAGYVGGVTYWGKTAANYDGTWSITIGSVERCFTAFSTLTLSNGDKRSTEYGPISCRVNVPLAVR